MNRLLAGPALTALVLAAMPRMATAQWLPHAGSRSAGVRSRRPGRLCAGDPGGPRARRLRHVLHATLLRASHLRQRRRRRLRGWLLPSRRRLLRPIRQLPPRQSFRHRDRSHDGYGNRRPGGGGGRQPVRWRERAICDLGHRLAGRRHHRSSDLRTQQAQRRPDRGGAGVRPGTCPVGNVPAGNGYSGDRRTYDVTYEYAGRTYVARTNYHPGDRIRVRVDVRPE